jgi:hypothetical protein
MFGKSEKKSFDADSYIKTQRELHSNISINEKVERQIRKPTILVYESGAMKALRHAGNFSGGLHNNMQKNVLLTGANNTYSRSNQEEIKADDLFITDCRIFATMNDSIVLEAFFNKNFVKNFMAGQANRNKQILEQAIPKPDKGDKYSSKLSTQVFGLSIVPPIGYVNKTNLLIGIEIKKSLILRQNIFQIEIATISSPIKTDRESGMLKSMVKSEWSISTSCGLEDKLHISKYEIKVKNEKDADNEQIMNDFVQNVIPSMKELKEYSLVDDGKKSFLSETFKNDFNL